MNDKTKALVTPDYLTNCALHAKSRCDSRAFEQAAAELTHLDALLREVRAERDALLQKPIDFAKMDSIDDETGTPDKMVAYYWWQQAQDARALLKERTEALREAVALLKRYRTETPLGHSPHMICHLTDAAIKQTEATLNEDTNHVER